MRRVWAAALVLVVSGCLAEEGDNNNPLIIGGGTTVSKNGTTGNNGGGNNGTTGNNGGGNNGTTGNNGENYDNCVDADGDGMFGVCEFGELDCDDADSNVATTCDTCIDADGDGYVGVCDAYDGLMGPDCDDADAANWNGCASCVDADSDGYFTGCDSYPDLPEDCDDSAAGVNPGASEIMGNNVDDDCNPGSVDDCSYTPIPAQDPEPGILAGITAAHNRWRVRVGLQPMTWNPDLADSSKAYAEECIWEHDGGRSPDAGFNYVGENLYASSQNPSSAVLLDSVQSWADERYDYDYGTPIGQTQGAVVGHYTQIVWDDSLEVGCGYANCGSIQGISFGGTVVVCRYGPGGNYSGELPYPPATGACMDLDNDDVFQGADPDDMDRSVQ